MSDCAYWSGNARPWSRPTIFPAMASPSLPSGRSRWPASRLTTNMSVSPIPSLLAREFADLDLLDREVPSTSELERRACEAEAAGLAVKGVTKSGSASASSGIGGMVLVTSTGFHGSYLRSSHGISMTAISGEGTGMERDYDFTSAPHASDLASPESVGRRAGERTVARVQSAQGRNLQGAGRVRSPGVGIAGRPSRRRHQRRLDRAQDELSERPDGRAAVREEHPHHRRSLAGARPAIADLRRRGRQE